MSESILSLNNLYLGYSQDKPVLHVEKVEIPRGKLVFLLGPSGIGKSTLLEFLGLMTDSCLNKSEGNYELRSEQGEALDLLGVWDRSDQEISAIRKEHLSFVFQSTNLMPNFSIGENMCFNLLMEGMTPDEAKEKVLDTMREVDLPEALFDKKVVEASGGQKQRIAFVRAFSTRFSVLFGDEPTGNLDEGNAIRLFEILKNKIKTSQKTAVVVSHDARLAQRFGDIIIEMQPGENGNPNSVLVH